MRKKLISVILIGLGIVALVGGILSATAFKPENQVTLSTPKMPNGNAVTASAEVLSLVDDSVTLSAKAPDGGEVALILARTADIEGWLEGETYYTITGAADWSTLTTKENVATVADPKTDDKKSESEDKGDKAKASEKSGKDADKDASQDGASSGNASGDFARSDMWITYVSGKGEQTLSVDQPVSGMSVLAISAAKNDGAPTIAATWQRDVVTPLFVPAVISGVVLALAGLVLLWLPSRRETARPASDEASLTSSRDVSQSGALTAHPENSDVDTKRDGWTFPAVSSATSPAAHEQSANPAPVVGEPAAPVEESTAGRSKRASLSSRFVRRAEVSQAEPDAAQTQALSDAVSAAFHSTSQGPRTGALSPSDAVMPVPPARAGGSHASAYSHSSSNSAPSVASVASAASVARAIENEPNLNTAEIKQLGLTRRQLREMRSAGLNSSLNTDSSAHRPMGSLPGATAGTSEFSSVSSAHSTASAHSEPRETAGTEPDNSTSSRTTASSWRAAWGVRHGNDAPETSSEFSQVDALERFSHSTSGVAQSAQSGPRLDSTPPTAPMPAEQQTTATSRFQAPNGQRDVRQPASWWSDPQTPPTAGGAAGRSSSGTSLTDSAASEGLASGPSASVPKPGTRRALYSSYRAEAERLSAQEDWPVPAPADDNAKREGGK